jgi:chemotaxis protein MotA
MFSIIGIPVVIGAIVGGYLMERGNLLLLLQPAEVLIIGGAAIGTMLIANPLPVLVALLKGFAGIFAGDPYNKERYLGTLKMLNDLFSHARKGGITSLEPDVEDPRKSGLFTKYEFVMKDHHVLDFICDTLRVAMTGTVSHFDLDQMIELDLGVHHWEANAPILALSDGGGRVTGIGHKVAAALVGTFLGILLCYGFFGPMAAAMTRGNEVRAQYFNCLRTGLIAFVRGAPAILAVEFSRRSMPAAVRPSFLEMEAFCKGLKEVDKPMP